MKRTLALFAAAVLLACPGPEEECNAEKACQTGYLCIANKCELGNAGGGGGTNTCPDTTNPSVPNLLVNPAFECGDPPLGWTEGFFATVSLVSGRSGNAAHLVMKSNSDPQTRIYLMTQDPVLNNPGVKNLCGSAYIRGPAAANATATIRRVSNGGNLDSFSFSQPLTTDWNRIETSVTSQPTDSQILFGVGLRGAASGTVLEIDDTQFWVSTQPDGGCTQR